MVPQESPRRSARLRSGSTKSAYKSTSLFRTLPIRPSKASLQTFKKVQLHIKPLEAFQTSKKIGVRSTKLRSLFKFNLKPALKPALVLKPLEVLFILKYNLSARELHRERSLSDDNKNDNKTDNESSDERDFNNKKFFRLKSFSEVESHDEKRP